MLSVRRAAAESLSGPRRVCVRLTTNTHVPRSSVRRLARTKRRRSVVYELDFVRAAEEQKLTRSVPEGSKPRVSSEVPWASFGASRARQASRVLSDAARSGSGGKLCAEYVWTRCPNPSGPRRTVFLSIAARAIWAVLWSTGERGTSVPRYVRPGKSRRVKQLRCYRGTHVPRSPRPFASETRLSHFNPLCYSA